MIVKAWFIIAVMSGVYTDGTKDIFIFNNPLDHGHFHNVATCQKFIGDHPFKLAKALINQYGKDICPLGFLLCFLLLRGNFDKRNSYVVQQ